MRKVDQRVRSYTIDQLRLGQSASFSKTVTEHDIYTFAGITGDFNPAHINEDYGKGTRFGGRIAHGILSAGFISTVIAMQLPGPGTIYLSQNLKFTAPVHIGDTVTATVTVTAVDPARNRALLSTACTTKGGACTVIEGDALVMPPLK